MQGKLIAVMIAGMLFGAGTAVAAQSQDAAHVSMSPQRDVALAHDALGKAEHRLRDALHDMSFTSPDSQSDKAMGAAYEAQNSTQRALALLPRDARRATHASFERSLERLQQAAQDDRETIQALADLPVSKARDAALDQTRQALLDTQEAMIDMAPQLAS